jgi:4-amino-4-deoxy-L-arabinose transferase-like glycosyltransferase
LLIVITAAIVLQGLYLLVNLTPMHWDPAYHMNQSVRVAQELSAAPWQGLWNAWVRDYLYYPSGYYLSTAPAVLLFGQSPEVAIAWQLLYLVLTLLVIARLVGRYAPPPWGACAAFVYLCSPYVLGLGRMVYIENLISLQLALFALVLLGDIELRRWRTAILLGLIAGWGQLTKWQFFLYVLPLAAPVLLWRLWQLRQGGEPEPWRALGRWLLVALGLCALVALPWYLVHLPRILHDLHQNAYVNTFHSPPFYAPSSLVYYWQALPWQLLGLPLSVLCFAALLNVLLRPKPFGPLLFAALGLVLVTALLTLVEHKQPRFIQPLLVLYVVLLGVWLARLPRGPRRGLVAVALAASLVNATAQTCDLSRWIPPLSVPIGFDRQGFFIHYGTHTWMLLPASRDHWGFEPIMERVAAEAAREGIEPTLSWCLMDDHPYYNGQTLASYAFVNDLIPIGFYPFILRGRVGAPETAQFLLCRLPEQDFPHTAGDETPLTELARWSLPDGSEARLYRSHGGGCPPQAENNLADGA